MTTDFQMKATSKPHTIYFQIDHGQEHHKSTIIGKDLKKWTHPKLFLLLVKKNQVLMFSAEIAGILATTFMCLNILIKFILLHFSLGLKMIGEINFVVLNNPQIIVPYKLWVSN